MTSFAVPSTPPIPEPRAAGRGRYILGADIGGTFTDFVLLDTQTGTVRVAKVLSDPNNPEASVFEGIRQLASDLPGFLLETEVVVHGTTLAINALIERNGPPVGMVVSEGFADLLEMRTGARGDMWDLSGRLPEPLIPRWRRFEASERVTARGEIERPLDPATVDAAATRLAAGGVQAIAVCFMHSYLDQANEGAARDILRRLLPDVPVTCSSDVLPVPGEFARFSATAANAYLIPVVTRYLPALEAGLEVRGLRKSGLRVLASEGSQCAIEVAQELPVRFVESGPVGGVIAGRRAGNRVGAKNVLVLDIGGTTAKTALIEDGLLPMAEEYEVAREYRFAPGSGIPLNVPSVDLLEVGAGGGSIAQLDALNLVRVGPRSAGSTPGPACYGRGGTEPTVTDADMLLGLLTSSAFARTDGVALASMAIEKQVAGRAGVSVAEAAMRIREVALATMATAIQSQIARSGIDASALTMIAYGGAGPLAAVDLARVLGIPTVVIPPAASVFSAFGMTIAPRAFTSLKAVPSLGSRRLDPSALAMAYADATAEARRALQLAGAETINSDIDYAYAIDVRYAGQGLPITVGLGPQPITDEGEVRVRFEVEYARRFGIAHEDQRIEGVGVRATLSHREGVVVDGTMWAEIGPDQGPITRSIFDGTPQSTAAKVYRREDMRVGQIIHGAALIEDVGTTVYVPHGAQAQPAEDGALVLRVAP